MGALTLLQNEFVETTRMSEGLQRMSNSRARQNLRNEEIAAFE